MSKKDTMNRNSVYSDPQTPSVVLYQSPEL